MNCPMCGCEVAPGAKFCAVCGASVTNQQPQQAQQPMNSQMPPQQVQQPMNPQVQYPYPVAPQPVAPQPPKKKKKNTAFKVIAVVLALLIFAGGGLFAADSIMFKKEIEAEEIITDFPVLKQKTDFVVYDEETFPSDHYKITVERIVTGNLLKSDTFRQTKVIIEDESTEPVYSIDFEEDGEYIITLEDISGKDEKETTTKAESTSEYNEPETEEATEAKKDKEDKDDKDESLIVVIRAKVEDASEEAIDKVDLKSRKGDDPVEIPEDISDSEKTEDIGNEENSEPEDVGTDADDNGTNADEPTTTPPADDKDESTSEFSMGYVSGNTYKNDFLGISCTVPENWVYYDEAKILEINNIASSYIDDSIVEQLSKANVIYDMYVIDESIGNSINVNLERLSAGVIEKYTLKQIAESQIPAMENVFKDLGYTDVETTYQKITVGDKSFDALKTVGNIRGIEFHSVAIMFRKGDYMACITVGSLQSDRTGEFLDYFTF